MSARPRLALALLLPVAACGLQWLLWDAWIKPYVWFLFFPAAFFSAWLGGVRGGLGSGVIGATLVWYMFMPPQFSFVLDNPASVASIAMFIAMAALFGWIFERLAQARKRMKEALGATEEAHQEITRLYEKTRELDELKSQFFANLSHELRTPLTLIMAPLEQKQRSLAGNGCPEPERQEIEMILRNARLLYRHVTDLLDAAKLEAGGMRVDFARLDAAGLVRVLASNFDALAQRRDIAYRTVTPSELTMEADGEKMQRILLNLLSNAFKFTPDGGRIEVRLSADGDDVLLEVQDTGPGVPVAMREAVFERFRQVEGSVSRHHGGTGLGLAIVREFSALHGGTAGVTEAPGGGALFAVRLPREAPVGSTLHEHAKSTNQTLGREMAEALTPRTPTPDDTPASRDNAPLVLVVEDNADMSDFITAMLRQRYRVAHATDGKAGLERALTLRPDLILADIMMPLMSGETMVQELRRHAELAGVPIIMLTAKADEALRVKMLQEGAQDYLAKPFTTQELLARVEGLLHERLRSGEQLRESESRFEATFEQAAVGIALVAPDGRWLRVNHRLSTIVGYTPDELMTKSFQDITHPDDLDADLGQVQRMLAREIDTYALEKRYLRKDGRMVWVNLTVSLVWHPVGRPDYFISVVEDISARKAGEAELKARNEELERFNHASVGRELQMIALKREVNGLAQALGRKPPYPLTFVDGESEGNAS